MPESDKQLLRRVGLTDREGLCGKFFFPGVPAVAQTMEQVEKLDVEIHQAVTLIEFGATG